jgi:drug/metabolite transporter (DMT)-like permease
MKEKIKNGLKILFSALGIVAIFDWIIAPGLTAQSTVINILSFLLAGVVSTIVGIILWDKVTEVGEEKEKEDEDGKIY